MEIVFWGAVALLVWGYAGYPLMLAALGAWRGRPVAAAPITPRVSLIVSVHNGERLIERKLDNCVALDYPADRLEILVASDGSTDATNALVRRATDPRVRLVAVERHLGKEAAQRAAIAAATGEILVFTDVGVLLAPDALRTLVANFADPTVGCVSGVDRLLDAAGAAVGEGAFVRYETLLKRLESRVGSIVGNSGWFFALRRPLCDAWPESMASDFTMLLRTVRRGFRGVAEPDAPAYAVATTSAQREFARKVRTIVRGMIVLAAHRDMLNPWRHGLFAVQLASHKMSRWLLPYLLLAIAGSSVALAVDSTFYRLALVAQGLFYGAGALVPSARIPRFFVGASLAALVAWWKFLAGERFVVWEPTPRTPARGVAAMPERSGTGGR
jgi:cellulose synthase/poly-beta-1,6-N-acetylglucosamine synthase-like glycosyltransferase